MKRCLFLAAIPLVVVLLLSFGCEKSKTVTGDGSSAIDSLLREAYQAMVDSNFTRADSLYDRVLGMDSDNSEAMFGKATCSIFLLQGDSEIADLIQFFEEFGDSFYFPKMGHMPKLGADLPLRMTQGAYAWFRKPFTGPPYAPSDLQDFIKRRVFPVVDNLMNFFEVIETDPGFVFTIYPDLCHCQDTIEIDLGDIYAAHAQLYVTHAVLNFLVSYEMDMGEDDTCLSFVLDSSWSTFMELNSEGDTLMPQAKEHILNAVDFCSLAVHFIDNETDDQDNDLIVLDPDEIDSAYSYLGAAKASMSDTIDVPVDGLCQGVVMFHVALGNLFDNPIENYKNYLPVHHFEDGCGELVIDEPLHFPDPTFNGLFPGMEDADWQQFFDCP